MTRRRTCNLSEDSETASFMPQQTIGQDFPALHSCPLGLPTHWHQRQPSVPGCPWPPLISCRCQPPRCPSSPPLPHIVVRCRAPWSAPACRTQVYRGWMEEASHTGCAPLAPTAYQGLMQHQSLGSGVKARKAWRRGFPNSLEPAC